MPTGSVPGKLLVLIIVELMIQHSKTFIIYKNTFRGHQTFLQDWDLQRH